MKRVAFVFPGQGAQFVGMGQSLFETSPAAKAVFVEADTVVPELSKVMMEGPAEKLTSTKYCQPAIFSMSMAALAALKEADVSREITPCFACGLSLGEYSALCAAGALSFTDTLRLVERRASLMEEAAAIEKGAMAAVIGSAQDVIETVCEETGAQVANYNAPGQIVITGPEANVSAASEKLKNAGAKRVIPLDVGGAFHSRLMQPAAETFKAELETYSFKPPLFPVLSNVDAQMTQDPRQIQDNLSRQITSSVQWVRSIESVVSAGVDTFLEIGPGNVLKGLIRKINKEAQTVSLSTPDEISAFIEM